jgi:hypothetical protein
MVSNAGTEREYELYQYGCRCWHVYRRTYDVLQQARYGKLSVSCAGSKASDFTNLGPALSPCKERLIDVAAVERYGKRTYRRDTGCKPRILHVRAGRWNGSTGLIVDAGRHFPTMRCSRWRGVAQVLRWLPSSVDSTCISPCFNESKFDLAHDRTFGLRTEFHAEKKRVQTSLLSIAWRQHAKRKSDVRYVQLARHPPFVVNRIKSSIDLRLVV